MRTSVFLAWGIVAFIVWASVGISGSAWMFFDFVSLVFMGVGGLALSVVAAPLRVHLQAIRMGLSEGPIAEPAADEARAALRGQAVAVLSMGLVGDLIGMTQMLQNLSDPAAVGPALAVSMLTVIYALFWCGGLIWPLDASIAARRQPAPPRGEGTAPAPHGSGVPLGLALAGYALAKGGSAFGLVATLGLPLS